MGVVTVRTARVCQGQARTVSATPLAAGGGRSPCGRLHRGYRAEARVLLCHANDTDHGAHPSVHERRPGTRANDPSHDPEHGTTAGWPVVTLPVDGFLTPMLFSGDFLYAAVVLFLVAIVAAVFGMRGIAGVTMEIAKIFVVIFLVLAIVALVL